MAAGSLILYHDWASTCSQKVRLALAEKHVDAELRLVRLRRFEHVQDDFLALNPDAMVPVLLHDGFLVKESSVITEYLDAVFLDPPLLPPDPRGRAVVGMWTRFIDQVTSPAIKLPSFAQNMVGPMREVGVEAIDAAAARMPNPSFRERWKSVARGGFTAQALDDANADLRRGLVRMTEALAASPWLAGPHYTLADVHMMPFVERLANLRAYDLAADWPAVESWRLRVRARPAFERARFTAPAA